MSILAIEYDNECAIPLMSVGNNSAVIVQGIVNNPIIDVQTYNSKQATGT